MSASPAPNPPPPPSLPTQSTQPQQPGERGFIQDVVLNVFEPGVNRSVLLFLNLSFVLLILTLVGLTVLVGINLHILLLIVLALGLMAGFNWFIAQLPSIADGESQSTTAAATHSAERTKKDS